MKKWAIIFVILGIISLIISQNNLNIAMLGCTCIIVGIIYNVGAELKSLIEK